MYPDKFEKVISLFERLPGVGAKTAQRYCFELFRHREDVDSIAEAILSLKEVRTCSVCGFLSEEDKCQFCSDETRDPSVIMVVSSHQEVVSLERTGMFNGLYHVLGGLISSSKGVYPEDIAIAELEERLDENVKEVILATSPTMDGEMTALYLDKILKDRNVLVTRLANGLPVGSSLDYADELTLIKAMSNRRKIGE